MAIDDLYTAGIASGWSVTDAATLQNDQTLEADVVIIGTGAGGGTAADILSAAGLQVLMLEEGPLQTAAQFKDMDEQRAYRDLYQEGAARMTADGAISVLQGRSVGGTTTVNWTSSFRTPTQTLARWAATHGVIDADAASMRPWFEQAEARLGVTPWAVPPNANNAVLRDGCDKLGWEWHVIPRNVRGCWNSGYCSVGCPVNAKQGMLVTTLPAALQRGASLIYRVRAQRLRYRGDQVQDLQAVALGADGNTPNGVKLSIRARHYVVAGGAINSPALLLRSDTPDPYRWLGKRTMIHPVVLTLAEMPDRVDPYYGAPQSIASDQFQWQPDGELPGFKLEVPPIFPFLASAIFGAHGPALTQGMQLLPHLNAFLALLRDGFHDHSIGGEIRVDAGGMPILDYQLSDYLWRGAHRAYLKMAEAQFAAGARRVMAGHLDSPWYRSWAEAQRGIADLPMKKFRAGVFTAHLMGGCAMGSDAKTSVCDSHGRHHQVQNLSVLDGSLFPTSIGANPQLSIYALISKHATRLAAQLRPVTAPSTETVS